VRSSYSRKETPMALPQEIKPLNPEMMDSLAKSAEMD
jgi:hypothetical protein